MKKPVYLLPFLGLLLPGCAQPRTSGTMNASVRPSSAMADADDEDDDGESEEEIPLSQVPDALKKAALAAVPGLVLDGAEKEVEKGVVLYCLEGLADGLRYEVEVTPAGKVVEVEQEDEEDDG